jgi:Carboxypeptidase regulatory-like domain
MKASVILILILSITTYGQQRNSTTGVPLPTTGTAGTVTLSLSEYNRLVELSTRKTKSPDVAPLPFVLTRAVFKLRVENQTLLGTVSIDGASLGKGPVKTPLTTGLTVLQADQSGNPLPLLLEGASHAAIFSGPGPFAVSLGVATPLTIDAGRASFTLPVPLAGSSLLSLELPGNHANVHVEPGLVTSRNTANGNTLIEASLDPGKAAKVWWTTREVAAPVAQREVRFLSDIKTVVSVGDSQLRLTALCDVNVIQGEPAEFKLPIPAGFELTDASGSSLESNELSGGTLTLRVHDPAKRNHQFLIAIERANRETKAEPPIFSFEGAQRETGEVLVEGIGAMELTATESGSLRRMDVREANAITRSLSHFPLQAAFRFNHRASEAPKLQLEWRQFSDADVLSAVADRATVTTLMTVEGRSLTEVMLRVRNHAQSYVKVELPPDAQLVTAEVEGQAVKPVQDKDGSRVPLLRPGLNVSGAYTVSFVYLSSGSRFAKNGTYDMGLPRLDLPINLLTWEVLLPDHVAVKQFGGNAISAEVFPPAGQDFLADAEDDGEEFEPNFWQRNDLSALLPGQIGGIVVDSNGAVIPGANVTVNTQSGGNVTTRSDSEGRWVIAGVAPGPLNVRIAASGFKDTVHELNYDVSRPISLGTTMEVGQVSAVVTVTGGGAELQQESRRIQNLVRNNAIVDGVNQNAPSQNVFNLQRRVAGILPVRMDVPRGGRSYRFVRPLVLDEETKITFQYKSR